MMSAVGTIVLQKSIFADDQNSAGRGRDFRVQDVRDLTASRKFTGDFGNAIEVMRLSNRSLLSVFARNLEPSNFRLLQQYRD
ncbi:hypothetical protein ACH79_09615 [Bradyrhizobium sp. CCBAU 051011]|nr:hypothetical protein ACH79_09615 [Bradyrhizobium sp. CCBAU 051011]